MGQSPQGFSPTQRTTSNRGKLRVREVVPSREKHTKWLPSAKQSAQNTYVQVTVYRFNRFFLGLFVCAQTYTNVITVSEERTHVFEAFGEGGFGERKRKGRK